MVYSYSIETALEAFQQVNCNSFSNMREKQDPLQWLHWGLGVGEVGKVFSFAFPLGTSKQLLQSSCLVLLTD